MPDAGLRSGGRKLCRRQPIDAIVKLRRHATAGMCNAGKMNHLIDPFEQRAPVEIFRQIRMPHEFDIRGECGLGLLPHRGAKRIAALRQGRYRRAAEKAGRAGHQKPVHGLNPVKASLATCGTAPKVSAKRYHERAAPNHAGG